MDTISYTQHAQKQMQRRAIPQGVIDLLLRFGQETHVGGAVRLEFNKKAKKRMRSYFGQMSVPEKLLDVYVIVSGDTVITAAHRTKKCGIH